MGLKTHLTLVCLFQFIRIIHQEECMNVTNMCPQSKDLWIERTRIFKCTERDTSYTCVLNGNNRLVETCIYEYSVVRGVAGCPFVSTCQGVHPQLATEDNYIKCPEEIPGCPKKDHEEYTIYEMYKYPACIFQNRSELLMTSTISAISSSDSIKTKFNTNHSSTKQNASEYIALAVSITVVVTLLLVMAFFLLIKFWKRARRKTRGRQQSMFEDDTDIQLVPPAMSNKEEGGRKQSTFTDDADIQLIPPAMSNEEEGTRYFEELKEILFEIRKYAVENIAISPVQTSRKMPVDLLFSKLKIITKDRTARSENQTDVGNSLTRFYIEMISILTERAKEKHEIDIIPDILDCENTRTADVPCISEHLNLTKYRSVWNKLGKLAYGGLMSGKYTFPCYVDTLGNALGMNESELAFCFNVGLLTREEVDSVLAKKVKIYFLHTSVQEFFAALYIAENENMLQSFLTRLSDIPAILQFGSVLKFLSGLNPTLGSKISQHVVTVMNVDSKVIEHRKFSRVMIIDPHVKLVYELMVLCYKEMTLSSKDSNSSRFQYQVSDVAVNQGSDKEIVKATAEILKDHCHEVRSLSIYISTNIENAIPEHTLSEFLDRTTSLCSLHISGSYTNSSLYKITNIFFSLTALILGYMTLRSDIFDALQSALQSNKVIETLGLECLPCKTYNDQNDEERSLKGIIKILPELPRLTSLRIQLSNVNDKPVLLEVLRRLKHLQNVEFVKSSPNDDSYDCQVVHHICEWTELQTLSLGHINLTRKGLKLPRDTTLRILVLYGVEMSKTDWKELIQVANLKNIWLKCVHTNIDDDIFSKLSRPSVSLDLPF